MLLAPLQGNRYERRIRSDVITIPPPIEGWVNKNDPRADNLTTARILTNMVPKRVYMESRKGYRIVAITGEVGPVESLISYETGLERTLIAIVNGKAFKCAETPNDPGTSAPLAFYFDNTTFLNSRFQSVNMANAADEVRTVMVNGEDGIWTYKIFDGNFTKETTTPDKQSLLDVTIFKNRLWFTEYGTSTIWYADPLVNKPTTLTPFYVGPLLKKGGSCVAINSVTLDGGSGPDDYLVVVSSEGEVAMFSGIDPGSDFRLIGMFSIGRPLGPRSLIKMNNDLMYYGTQGPEALGKLLGGLGRVNILGNPIQDEFEYRIKNNFGAHGWSMVLDTKNSWVLCNVPIVPPNQMRQYVLSLETGGWFEITGWNASSWAMHNGELYFGNNKGQVCIANFGYSDNGSSIPVDYMANWNEYGNPQIKKFNLCKMTIRSIAAPEPYVSMMTNYEETIPTGVVRFPGDVIESPWDTSSWNISPWSSSARFNSIVFGLNDYGYVGALRYRENLRDSFIQIFGYQLAMELGEIL